MIDDARDHGHRPAVIDLLGALAYGELMAFSQLAADAEMAPSQPEKAAVARLAVAEFHHYEAIMDRLTMMGVDPDEAVAPFVDAVDHFHERTKPKDWLEGLVRRTSSSTRCGPRSAQTRGSAAASPSGGGGWWGRP